MGPGRLSVCWDFWPCWPRGPIVRFLLAANWAPDRRAPGPICSGSGGSEDLMTLVGLLTLVGLVGLVIKLEKCILGLRCVDFGFFSSPGGDVCPTLPVFSSPTSSHTRLTSKNYSIQVKLFIKFVCVCQYDTVKADLEVFQRSII